MPISSKKSLKNLNEEILICKCCLDLAKTRKSSVPGTGASNARLLIVGYFPSEEGAEASRTPFTGDDEGNLTRKMIEEAGRSIAADTYLTYLVKCTPRTYRGEDRSAGASLSAPLLKHINNCLNFLTEEISIITPHVIVSLGLEVTNIILKNFFSVEKEYTDMSRLHMRLFENPSFKLIPFYSAKEVKQGMISEEKYIEDFKSLSRFFELV